MLKPVCNIMESIMPTLYYGRLSGHSYKIRLFLSLIGLGYESSLIDIKQGEGKTEGYLKINPLGQVPVWQEGELIIRDSQAILVYLSQQYGQGVWKLPSIAAELAQIIQWLSFAANEISHSVVPLRRAYLYKKDDVFPPGIDVPLVKEKTQHVLNLLNVHLTTQEWLSLGHASIADIACFAYIALIEEEIPFSLDEYPHVKQWIERIRSLNGYIPLTPAV